MIKSIPAQVGAVFDSNGKIHPLWCKFRDDHGAIITIKDLKIEKENAECERYHRNFMCSNLGGVQRFCLSYNTNSHSWTIEIRSNDRDYRYMVADDRSEFR